MASLEPLPALLFTPLDHHTTIEVTGADRQSWLNGLVTCNLAPLKPGQGAYGLATSKVGKILADLDILILPERLMVSCPTSRAAALLESLDRYLVMEDVEFQESGAWRWFVLHGASAAEAAGALASELGGHSAGLDRTGLGDAALVVPAAMEERARAGLGRIGAPLEEYDWARLERGVPIFGQDFDEHHYPQEAVLEKRAVSFSKGCYLGQEVICRLEMRGHVSKRLALLEFEGEEAPARGAAVLAEGVEVGQVTSAAVRPGSGKALAMAMVKYAQSEPDTKVVVAGREAVVVRATGAHP
jgi:folate-binding protein YgfZ